MFVVLCWLWYLNIRTQNPELQQHYIDTYIIYMLLVFFTTNTDDDDEEEEKRQIFIIAMVAELEMQCRYKQ